ncbi:DUF4304 domain-containing protein [Kineosporia babensis]|uniref:DUF4304 domain-containing protein n=1 Tax=Kineosporia babensis TaxID=499548 RepID=A0A9X1NKL2_9ACTN|nr:DUF4304 domain-containing protein [Kineosporia babensis]MCD5315878.1 DUF4304 domain-containing protein [Kineosporia babensis]
METAHDAYRRMLRDELRPRLQALGFIAPALETDTRHERPAFQTIGQENYAPGTGASDFRLEIPGYYALLAPQEYWGNNSASFQFTINVLVTSHPQWQAFRENGKDFMGNPWPAEPDTSTHYGPDGPWTQRLGPLMGVADKWWYISARRPTDPVAEEVANAVATYALPAISERTL